MIKIIGNPTTTPSTFVNITDVAINSRKEYLVVDRGNHRVVRLDQNGYFLDKIGGATLGVPGNANGEFNTPTFIAMDARDYIYVLDNANARFQIFSNATGTTVTTNITRIWTNG
jgi:hypothetical protein